MMSVDALEIVAKVILHDSRGRILVLRRSETHPHQAFHLDFPGGEVDEGETPLDAVWRETQEEAGLILDRKNIELVHETMYLPGIKYVVYRTHLPIEMPPVVVSWEHDQFEWLHPRELLSRPVPHNVDSYYKVALDHLASLYLSENI